MPDNVDITVNPRQLPQLAPDPHLVLPPAVRKQIAAADEAHKKLFGDAVDPNKPVPVGETVVTPEPPKETPAAEGTEPPAASAPAAPAAEATPAVPAVPAEPPAAEGVSQPAPKEITPEQWDHYTKSMQGRYKQQGDTIKLLQTQLMEMGDEVQRLTAALTTRTAPVTAPVTAPPLTPQVRKEDVDNFGQDLIDVAKRAALEATAPQLTKLEQENEALKKRLHTKAVQDVYSALDRDVPDWRQINSNPRFKLWLRLPDIYSRTIRGKLLSEAFGAADAARVVEFFKGFIRDEVAVGQIEPEPVPGAQPPAQPAPRQPAMSLEAIASPRGARPATEVAPSQGDKPVYTHAQIKKFYDDVRRGAWIGREADKMRIEQDMIAAQNEGRIRVSR